MIDSISFLDNVVVIQTLPNLLKDGTDKKVVVGTKQPIILLIDISKSKDHYYSNRKGNEDKKVIRIRLKILVNKY